VDKRRTVKTGWARPAVFVDRDGTIILERNYLADPEQVELLPGAGPGLRSLSNAGYALVMITNQSGIARGFFDEDAYEAVRDRIGVLLADESIRLDAVLHCPHHPDFTGPCDCRKPGLALYRQAIEELNLDAGRSWMIGDRLHDLEPARLLGSRAILVRTGYGAEEAVRAAEAGWPVAEDMADAARRILAAGAEG
jgi:D-glycero-D-manno-heptose 1,7-bisphosphate phosphatase